MKTYHLNNDIIVTQEQLDHWNEQLIKLETPQEIIAWSIVTFPHLFQTTAFGLTGLVTIDMLSKLSEKYYMPELLFIDTLHHFPQTLTLKNEIEKKYYQPKNQTIHVYKPDGCESEADFASKYGDFLWEKDDDKYDYLAKVEPAHRAYKELHISAVFTGRRKSQGSARSQLSIIEIDELNGILKINPLINWTFEQVKQYIEANNVPYNELLDLGYRSIGDYHSTQPVKEGEDERAGRWKGKAKTECGIHEASRFAQFLKQDA
ncbi:CDG_1a_G0057120.mRNA.1.CDS.1 [Saccharomyces cerevisiae]|nr:CDG_1a_G0057120.mRNA.1.CDS.1 [Saccharomyces cerevisiae]CAI7489825.1 CDG_1a_G0057120.mRNA.1.CDS.1 [Saccharomyces cerevisiae]